MAKLKLTKGELKKQRDALKQFERYLPTLQLKKQQLQLEILNQSSILEAKKSAEAKKSNSIEIWAGLLSDGGTDIYPWIKPKQILSASKNIAGVNLPVFKQAIFEQAEYDLFLAPLWIDAGIDALKELITLRQEIRIINQGVDILKRELRITAQRVNLFEKVKIPEAKEDIRLIKIYIGDQLTNAVGRCKIAKRKIEQLDLAGVAA
jgi:V/A-type H+-transporting ATPase subunit D